jgi:hypothetical protein
VVVAKKKVVAASVSSTEAFPMAGLALQVEVPTTVASIPDLKAEEEYWNSDLNAQLEAVEATSMSTRLWEILPTTSQVLDPRRHSP